MKLDLDQLAATAEPIRAQVCVVGAGIAGLVLAQKLAANGTSVALLEGGGDTLEPRSQQMFHAEMSAETHKGANEGRYRMLGGSSPYWGAQMIPFPPEVFAPGELASDAWPIAGDELQPYLEEAQCVLGLDDLPFDGPEFLEKLQSGATVPEGLRLRFTKWAPFSRRNLAKTVAVELVAGKRVTIYTHANVTRIELRDGGARVAAVIAKNYAGRAFRFEAEHFVLAAGTIESCRLLLVSDVGNAYDQVGRGFYDHVSLIAAELSGEARETMLAEFAPYLADGTTHSAKLEASPALRLQLGTLAVLAHMTIEEPEDSGAAVAREVLQAVQHGAVREAVRRAWTKGPRALAELAALAWSAVVKHRRHVSPRARVMLRIDAEQRAESRIRLHESAVDALGLPRVVMDWRVGAETVATMRTFAAWLRDKMPRVAFRPELFDESTELTGIADVFHPMGGLRMGTDERTSVVDTELTVHGVENLSVLSAAVYPSGGCSTPTLTLLCLALRLAAKLKA